MHPAIFELKKRLEERYGERLVRFIVFGSYIRGDNTPESDIDILVTLKGHVDWKTKFEVLDISFKIELEHDLIFDIKVYSEEKIEHTIIGATPFIEAVKKEGVRI